jgi:hypothetical protein
MQAHFGQSISDRADVTWITCLKSNEASDNSHASVPIAEATEPTVDSLLAMISIP